LQIINPLSNLAELIAEFFKRTSLRAASFNTTFHWLVKFLRNSRQAAHRERRPVVAATSRRGDLDEASEAADVNWPLSKSQAAPVS